MMRPPGLEVSPPPLRHPQELSVADASEVPVPGLEDSDRELDEPEVEAVLACEDKVANEEVADEAASAEFQAPAEVFHGAALEASATSVWAPTAQYATGQVLLIRRHRRIATDAALRASPDAAVNAIIDVFTRAQKEDVASRICGEEEEQDEERRATEAKKFLAHIQRAQPSMVDFGSCRLCALCDKWVTSGKVISDIVFCLECESEAREAVRARAS